MFTIVASIDATQTILESQSYVFQDDLSLILGGVNKLLKGH